MTNRKRHSKFFAGIAVPIDRHLAIFCFRHFITRSQNFNDISSTAIFFVKRIYNTTCNNFLDNNPIALLITDRSNLNI